MVHIQFYLESFYVLRQPSKKMIRHRSSVRMRKVVDCYPCEVCSVLGEPSVFWVHRHSRRCGTVHVLSLAENALYLKQSQLENKGHVYKTSCDLKITTNLQQSYKKILQADKRVRILDKVPS